MSGVKIIYVFSLNLRVIEVDVDEGRENWDSRVFRRGKSIFNAEISEISRILIFLEYKLI